jgi:hypothetical protein
MSSKSEWIFISKKIYFSHRPPSVIQDLGGVSICPPLIGGTDRDGEPNGESQRVRAKDKAEQPLATVTL